MMLEQSFQAKFLIPMAVSIVFGLAFATVITLMMLPVLYLVLEDFKHLVAGLWSVASPRGQQPATVDQEAVQVY